ncbi:MAG: LysM peptidoglycan-binding domain-containing protein [Pseudomonadota bacterium]
MPCFYLQFLSIAVTVLTLVCPEVSLSAGPDDNQAMVDQTDEEEGFYYIIQKGDTLWNLSKKFYNSQWDWPGLWEINDKLKNPHWIYPGKRIRIFQRQTPIQPAQTAVRQEPLPQVPEKEPDVEISPAFSYPGMENIGFIRKTAVSPAGRLIKSDDGEIMISAGRHLFIEPMGPEALIPDHLYAVYTTEPMTRKQEPRFMGIKHTMKGIIRILENNQTFVTGTVIKSFRNMGAGDLIMPFDPPGTNILVEKSPPTLNARILGHDDPGQLMSDLSIAFMDKGDNDKVKPGQIYTIFREQEPADSMTVKKGIRLPPLEMGKLIVLRTEDIASTVLILSSNREIPAGALVD